MTQLNLNVGDQQSVTDSTSRKVTFIRKNKDSSSPVQTVRDNIPLKVGDIRKFECKNIVEACYFLEHVEQYEKKPAEREMDKELVLAEMRNKKMNEMFELLKEFEDASDPKSLKMMFIYKDIVNQEYDEEQRMVTKEYHKAIMDPMREVARIELKGNASTRIGKPRQTV